MTQFWFMQRPSAEADGDPLDFCVSRLDALNEQLFAIETLQGFTTCRLEIKLS